MRAYGVIALAPALSLALACGSEDRNPLVDTTGGGQGGVGAGPDAAPIEDLPRTVLSGSICEVVDLRQPGACVASPSNISIAAEFDDASSDGDGEFGIEVPGTPSSVDLTVTDSAELYRSTIVRVKLPSDGAWPPQTVPIIDDELMLGFEGLLGEAPSDNAAILIVYALRDGEPLAGAVLQAAPGGTIGGSYYDSNIAPFLDIGAATGPSGVIAIFGVPAGGEVQIDVTPALGEESISIQMPTAMGGITFHTAELPSPS